MSERSVNKGYLRFRTGEATLQKGAVSLKPPTHLEGMGGVINDVADQLRRDAKQIIQKGKNLPQRVSETARRITGGITILRISNEEAAKEEAAKKAEKIKQRKEEQTQQVSEKAGKVKGRKDEETEQVDERAKEIQKRHEEKKDKKGK